MTYSMRSFRWIAVLVAAVMIVGCGYDEEAENQNQNDVPQQNTGQNQQQNQGEQNQPQDYDDDCQRDADGAGHFEIPIPEGFDEAHYAALLRVEDEIWVSYVAVDDGSGDERIHLVRLSCDGEPVEEPMPLGFDGAEMELGAAMGADDSVVYVVWPDADMEDQTAEIRGRTFDVDGTPRQEEPFTVEGHIDGESDPLTLGFPEIAVDHHGQGVVIGETNVDDQVLAVLQRIDADGQPVGNGFFLDDSIDDHQIEPVVSVMADNHILFAYIVVEGFGGGEVYHGTVRHDGSSVDEGPLAAEASIGGGNLSESLSLSTNRVGDSTWMTYPRGTQAGNAVVIREGAQLGPAVGDETTSIPGRASHLSDVSASETGGAITWLSGSTARGRVHFQRFDGSGIEVYNTGPIVDEHDEEDNVASSPFGPRITWLFDDVYAAVWVERDDDATVEGRILDFAEFEEE